MGLVTSSGNRLTVQKPAVNTIKILLDCFSSSIINYMIKVIHDTLYIQTFDPLKHDLFGPFCCCLLS